ncbi:MAG: hypothetical protein WB716_08960, partial [Candidatus Acidiferrales bacterium]
MLAAAEAASQNCWAKAQEQEALAAQPVKEIVTKKASGDAAKPPGQLAPEKERWREGDNSLGPHLLKDFAGDQKEIWTSPFHLRMADADWLVPLGIAAGGMFATDTEVSKHLSNSPSRLDRFKNFSNYGIASMAGAAGGLYL